jgi:uncharacterized protein (TIGR02117 family)
VKWRLLPGVIVLAVALVTLTTAEDADRRLYPPPPDRAVAIYLIDNGFHSDLAFPAASMTTGVDSVAIMARAAGPSPWVVFGWGDAKFYTRQGLSAARAADGLRALFMPGNPSVVRVEGLDRSPDRAYAIAAARRILVSPEGLAAMRRRIDASIASPRPLAERQPGDPDAVFYPSVEPFSLVHLCNHWTAQVLHAGGLPITPVLDTLPAGLKLDLRLRADGD